MEVISREKITAGCFLNIDEIFYPDVGVVAKIQIFPIDNKDKVMKVTRLKRGIKIEILKK